MTPFVSRFTSAKSNTKTAISAHAVQVQTTPFRQLLAPQSSTISSPCWTPGVAPTGTNLKSESTGSLSAYNKAMAEIASKVAVERKPKTSQLDSWREALQKKGSITFRKQLKTAWLFVMG